jgi:hypothetical protein
MMQQLSFILGGLILSGLGWNSAQQSLRCVELPSQIDEAIQRHATASRAAEYCPARKIAFGDIDSDNREDITVVYNLEGACGEGLDAQAFAPGTCGNGVSSFLTVFLRRDSGFQQVPALRVGAIRFRGIAALSVEGSMIKAETLEWAAGDANCCPSKKGRAAFALVSGALQESNP